MDSIKVLTERIDLNEAEIIGLQSKIDALLTILQRICKSDADIEVLSQFDDLFWESFQHRFAEIPNPSGVLRDAYEEMRQT